jgi:choline kinase
MKAIILAAGRGSRMKGLTEDRPKCLVELDGHPLLARQLEALRAGGADEIAIVTGYRREMLAGMADAEFHNPRWASTNMVTSLAEATDWLGSGPCIVSYSDIFYAPSAVRSLIDCDAPLAVTYDPDWRHLWTDRFGDPLLDAETFRLDAAGYLAEIGNRPTSVDEVEGQYMGLLRFTPEGWAEVEAVRVSLPDAARDALHMTGALQHVIGRGRVAVRAVPYVGPWGEVDSEEDLRLYEGQG